jgi:hypothetical protein
MRTGSKWMHAVALLLLVCSVVVAQAQDSRAVQDAKAFFAKFEEGDSFFNQKKYAEAATALAASQELYQRAVRRDPEVGRTDMNLNPGTFPALRYYGYGFGSNASLTEMPSGAIQASAAGLHSAMVYMWQDSAILSGAAKFPAAGVFDDPEMWDMSEENLGRVLGDVYRPVSGFELPVPDNEWRDVVYASRRAQLMVEYAQQNHSDWKPETPYSEMLADIHKKLTEAEPEYAKIAADFKNAAPSRVTDWLGYKIEDIEKATAGANNNGWVEWNLARDLFITNDYLAGIRKAVAPMYAEESKSMPPDALKPLEDKIAALKSTMEKNASKWKFPAEGHHNANFEAKAVALVKSKISGATVLKTVLDSGEWIITKNDLDIPKYRSMGILVLTKIPGQTKPWLVFTYLRQSYSGGGTYNSGGTVQDPSDVRIQAN